VPPIFFIEDDVVGVFPTVEQAVRSVDPTDVATTRAYDAEGRQVVLRVEEDRTVLDVGGSGSPRADELRSHLVARAEEVGLTASPSTLSLPELVDAFVRASTGEDLRPSPFVLVLGLALLVLGVIVAVLLW